MIIVVKDTIGGIIGFTKVNLSTGTFGFNRNTIRSALSSKYTEMNMTTFIKFLHNCPIVHPKTHSHLTLIQLLQNHYPEYLL